MIAGECVDVTSAVAVVRAGGEYRLVANRPAVAGELLFTIEGELTATPNRYTVQIGHDVHVDVPAEFGFEAILDQFFWRFMNHSCEPTVFIRDRSVIALKPVVFGQDITFNYNTTEFDMAEPFACQCGSERCIGRVQGYRHLSDEDRQRLRPWLADHLSCIGAR